MYKSKVKKVQLVDEADGIGNFPRGRNDWYKCLKVQDILQ